MGAPVEPMANIAESINVPSDAPVKGQSASAAISLSASAAHSEPLSADGKPRMQKKGSFSNMLASFGKKKGAKGDDQGETETSTADG